MGSLGTSLVAWLGLPALLYAGSVGIGLLLERLAGSRVPDALLAPVGFCVAVAALLPGYRLGAGAWLAAVVFVFIALAGLVLGREGLRRRLMPGWIAAAGLAVYALYMAPVLGAGGWTWTGYNFVNDTAVQFLLADYLGDHGTATPPGPPGLPPQSNGLETVRSYFDTGYPLGIHSLLATLDAMVPGPLASIYQPLIASCAALGAMSLAWLAAAAGLPGLFAATAGTAAMASNLTYNYGLQGNIKEIAFVAALAGAAGTGAQALRAERPVRAVVAVALCLAASIALFSAAALPYVGTLSLALLLASFWQADSPLRRRLLPACVLGAAVLVVASLPTIPTLAHFGDVAVGTFAEAPPSRAVEFGHLVRPLPLAQAVGVWLSAAPDYRFPLSGSLQTVTAALILLAAAAFVLGCFWLMRRRQVAPLLLVVAAGLVLAILGPRVSPYAAGKILAILSPAVILVAAFGFVAAARRRFRPVVYALAGVLALGILVSDGISYRNVKLAPVERLEALTEASRRVPARDRDLYMIDDFEELAKFVAEGRENVALEPITAAVRDGQALPVEPPLDGRSERLRDHVDLDQMRLDYVTSFSSIVQRRGPTASRPPASFERVYSNRWWTVWSRRTDPVTVVLHASVQSLHDRRGRVSCGLVRQLLDAAQPGDRVTAAFGPELVLFDTVEQAAGLWPADPMTPGAVKPTTPGTAEGTLSFAGGRYRVWLRADVGRRIEIAVDGRHVGSARSINTPGAWLPAGTVSIAAGRHSVAVSRPDRSLRPGDRFLGQLGPVAFERVEAPRLVQSSANAARRRFCGETLDWVELTRK